MKQFVGKMDISGDVFGFGNNIRIYFDDEIRVLYIEVYDGDEFLDSTWTRIVSDGELYTGEDILAKKCLDLAADVTILQEQVNDEEMGELYAADKERGI